MQEEDPQQMAHQANEAEARQGTLLAALPSAAASQDQDSAPVPVSTAVSVTVSVQDIPALSAPAKQQVPTLLPHSFSSHRLAAQTSSPEPLVPSLLKALSQAQGKAQQPSAGLLQTHVQPHVDHLDPFIQTQAELQSQAQSRSEHHASRDDATHSVDHPRSPTHHEGVGHDSSAARAGQSGHSAQAFSLASAMAEHFHHPPRTEAERYSLHSAISRQFGSLLSPDSQHSSPQVLPQDICGNAAFPRAAGPSMAGDAADHAAAGPSTAGDAADHAAAGPSMAGDAADRTVAGPISAGDEASPQDSGQQPERGESGAGGSVVDRLIRNKFDSLSGAPHTAEPSPSADDAAAPVAHSQVCIISCWQLHPALQTVTLQLINVAVLLMLLHCKGACCAYQQYVLINVPHSQALASVGCMGPVHFHCLEHAVTSSNYSYWRAAAPPLVTACAACL